VKKKVWWKENGTITKEKKKRKNGNKGRSARCAGGETRHTPSTKREKPVEPEGGSQTETIKTGKFQKTTESLKKGVKGGTEVGKRTWGGDGANG